MTTNAQTFSADNPSTSTMPTLTPADVARQGRCHPNTVKAVAVALRLDVARLANGTRVFTRPQADKIVAELARRRGEELRR
jgi:hypothetical protein